MNALQVVWFKCAAEIKSVALLPFKKRVYAVRPIFCKAAA